MDTLAFGYILPTTGRIPDLHRLETCAAGRTIQKTLESILSRVSIEATTRFELVIRVLQTHALPLGYVAIFIIYYIHTDDQIFLKIF